MFSNIGGKIKTVAVVFCFIGIMLTFIVAFTAFAFTSDMFYGRNPIVPLGIAFLVLIVGSLLSWIGSFFTYGFGQLIESAQSIDEKLSCAGLSNDAGLKKELMKKWLNEGLVTKDEYNETIR